MKTDKQTVLELQRRSPIEDILRDAFEAHRGQKHMMMLVAVDLGVTDATLYNWCSDLGIDIDEYRRPAVGEAGGE